MMRAVALVLFALSLPGFADERVLDFHSRIAVARDGTLTVTETIAVQAERRSIRRGIQRDFPTDYRDRTGASVKVPFEVLSVTQDGRPASWQTMAMANGVRTRIGDPRVLLAPGRHVYAITYRTSRQVGFFRERDELYWNVNGNGWTFPFDALSAEVVLPEPVEASRLKLEAYTGVFGARGRSYEAHPTASGAAFHATRRLSAGEGLTIVVGFPKGLVAQPALATRARWWLHDNQGVAAGIAGFALLVAFLYWRWTLVGRDPRAGPKFPRYDPPPGIGPAGVRYVDCMGYDDRCFAAGLVGLAQRGFLRIRQQEKRIYSIERTGAAVAFLPGERPLAAMLRDSTLTFGGAYDPAVAAARDHFIVDLKTHVGTRLFSKNSGALALGMLIAVVTGGLMVAFEAPWQFGLIIGAVLVVTLYLFSRWLPAYSVEGRKLKDEIDGLRQYMSVADSDELRRMKAPPQTCEEFTRLFAYALALDVEKTWADRFVVMLGAAAVAAAVQEFYDSDTNSFDAEGAHALADSMSGLGSTISSAATPPGSSSGSSDSGGGGGGGSSGGGGGGGGGSGW